PGGHHRAALPDPPGTAVADSADGADESADCPQFLGSTLGWRHDPLREFSTPKLNEAGFRRTRHFSGLRVVADFKIRPAPASVSTQRSSVSPTKGFLADDFRPRRPAVRPPISGATD